METIKEAIIELQNNVKESAKIIASEFNSKCQNISEKLSTQISDMTKYAKDSKDQSIEVIHEKYDSLKQIMVEYQKSTGEKMEEYRISIVKKLNELSKMIEDYNNNHKH